MIEFINEIKQKAKRNPKRVIFPESALDEPRTLQAVRIIQEEKTAIPVLVGDQDKLGGFGMTVLDPSDSNLIDRYANILVERRKNKGVTLEQARQLLKNPNYFGVTALLAGDVDGMISGSIGTTAETVKPALEIIKTKEKFHKVSGFFFMVLENRLLLFADCAINVEPNSRELADIAIDTAETAKRFGIVPRVAMLSFSTAGSSRHPNADKVREAAQMVQHYKPELVCDGEMQVDAALVTEICKRKNPNAKVCGDANVLIFPNLDAANIAYKLVERLAKAHAVGPILQGLQKPVNDLSRGCSVEDIVNLAAITTLEVKEENYR